jgi:hypothetical protein
VQERFHGIKKLVLEYWSVGSMAAMVLTIKSKMADILSLTTIPSFHCSMIAVDCEKIYIYLNLINIIAIAQALNLVFGFLSITF